MATAQQPADVAAIALPARVARDDVPRLWRELAPRAGVARQIDLAQVRAIDSAGVALVLALADLAGATVANAPARYDALVAAHRAAPGDRA